MNKLCGDCRLWKQSHRLDHIERDEVTGEIESMHFGGRCTFFDQVTYRDEWCRKQARDADVEQQERIREAIRRAQLKNAARNGPKKRWRFERPFAPKPRGGLVIEQVMMRYGLRKNLAKALMELAGPSKIPNGTTLWCAQDALDAVMRDYRDKPAAALVQDARAARDRRRVFYMEDKEAPGNGDQDTVQKPEGG